MTFLLDLKPLNILIKLKNIDLVLGFIYFPK